MPEQNINSDLIRGHIDTIILKILKERDNYGYEIMKAVSVNSGNEYELKEPSLYTSLKRLEKQVTFLVIGVTSHMADDVNIIILQRVERLLTKGHLPNGCMPKRLLQCFFWEVQTNDRFAKIC